MNNEAAERLYDLLDVEKTDKVTCEQLCDAMKNMMDDDKIDLKLVFKKLDKNNNGYISKEDFINGYDQFVMSTADYNDPRSNEDLSEYDRSVRDTFDEGRINELVAQFNEMKMLQKETEPLKDENLISFNIFVQIMSKRLGYDDINNNNKDMINQLTNVFQQMDHDNDGYICQDDFLNSFGNVMTRAISQFSFNSFDMDESWEELTSNRSINELPDIHFSPSVEQHHKDTSTVEHFVTADSSNDIHSHLLTLKKEVRNLKASNKTVTKRTEELQEFHEQVLRENDSLHLKLKRNNKNMQNLQNEMNKLQEDYDQQLKENQTITYKFEKLKKETAKHLESSKNANQIEEELRQQLKESEKQIKLYESQYKQLDAKTKLLEKQLLERAHVGLEELHANLILQQQQNSNIIHGGLSSNSLMNVSDFSQSNESLEKSMEMDMINNNNNNNEEVNNTPLNAYLRAQLQEKSLVQSNSNNTTTTGTHERIQSIQHDIKLSESLMQDEIKLDQSSLAQDTSYNLRVMSSPIRFEILKSQEDYQYVNWCQYIMSAFYGFLVILLFPFFAIYFCVMNYHYIQQHKNQMKDTSFLDVIIEDKNSEDNSNDDGSDDGSGFNEQSKMNEGSKLRSDDLMISNSSSIKKAQSVPANLHISSSLSASNDLYQLP